MLTSKSYGNTRGPLLSHSEPSFGVTPSKYMEKLYGS